MIEIENLTKRFGRVTAVKNLSLVAWPGRVTGFLGPNGAGKTTTLRTALSLLKPTSGRVTFDGREYRAITRPGRVIGASLEASSFHPGRSGRDHLRMLAPCIGVSHQRCDDVLEVVGLGKDAGRRVGQYSLGMRARLSLAGAMLGDPGTLLLDEPANGLDPEGIAWMRGLLRGLASEGRTVLVSSHLLAEAQLTVDDVAIIAQGELIRAGRLEDLDDGAHRTFVVAADPARFGDLARARRWDFAPEADGIVVVGPSSSEIGEAAAGAGLALYQLATRARGLEAAFLDLTSGKGLG